MKAFAVTEHMEGTGFIIFAHHAIAARIRGANELADGEITEISCKRAPWADAYADTRRVPASVLVANGWRFDCCGCGVRIDTDLAFIYEEQGCDPETTDHAQRFKGWTPEHVTGFDQGEVFCNAACEAEHEASKVRVKALEERIRATYRRMLLRKFPGAQIEGKGHVYVTERERDGRTIMRVEQVRLLFDFPGRRGPLAELRFQSVPTLRGERRITAHVRAVDYDAFDAWRNGMKIAA